MKTIATHLWFDKEAKEAAAFYTSVFKPSKIRSTTTLHNTPSDDADVVAVDLCGSDFRLLAAGPLFKVNPSVSFLVACEKKDEVDALWATLSKGGSALMELGSYPFSERYGWLRDRYGLSWQLMFTDRPIRQKITPALMFTTNDGKAEEAVRFYTSVFPRSSVEHITRFGKDAPPDREGKVAHAAFKLNGQQFAAMDGGRAHDFTFNEAISFMVLCDSQQEIDRYWAALSADPKAEQCGWLKDKYGLSWQVTPAIMDQMLASGNEKGIARMTQAFLQMKKFDVARLEAAFEG